MKYIPVLFLVLLLGGCSTVSDMFSSPDLSLLQKAAEVGGQVEDTTLGNAMKALPQYCKLPGFARSTLRSRANARPEAEGAKIAVHCPGDDAVVLGP